MTKIEELASLQPGFVPKDLVAALNHSVINFASDSADVPASTREFLQKAADDLKGFVRVTASPLRMAQHAQTEAATRPRGRATRPTRRLVFVCKLRG